MHYWKGNPSKLTATFTSSLIPPKWVLIILWSLFDKVVRFLTLPFLWVKIAAVIWDSVRCWMAPTSFAWQRGFLIMTTGLLNSPKSTRKQTERTEKGHLFFDFAGPWSYDLLVADAEKHLKTQEMQKEKNLYHLVPCIGLSWSLTFRHLLGVTPSILSPECTWNPNDPCFVWKRPSFRGLKPQNRGQTGSR